MGCIASQAVKTVSRDRGSDVRFDLTTSEHSTRINGLQHHVCSIHDLYTFGVGSGPVGPDSLFRTRWNIHDIDDINSS